MTKLTEEQARLVGELITAAMRSSGLTNVHVANKASVDEGTVRTLKRGFGTRNAAEKVCDVLKIDLEKELRRGAEAASVSGHSASELGGYSREVFQSYVGVYVTVRPAYGKRGVLKCYETEIDWDENKNCLCFDEARTDRYGQSGSIYVPPAGSYIYLMTINKGFVRTVIVSREDTSSLVVNQMRGLILSQYNVSVVHHQPICTPIVYVRGGIEEVGEDVRDSEILFGSRSYDRFASLLSETLSRDFATIQLVSEMTLPTGREEHPLANDSTG